MYRLFFALFAALSFTAAPAHALTESQQDAAISQLQSAVASLQSTVSSQETTINTLTAKLQYVTASGHDLTLTGNLHVVSGSGKTNGMPNGLGNVIIGYNEARTSDPYGGSGTDTRTGSHNLILGDETNYSSYGGIIAGDRNGAEKPFASVTGGCDNTASGVASSVSGGDAVTEGTNYGWAGGSLHSP